VSKFQGEAKNSSALLRTTQGVSACPLTVPWTAARQNAPPLAAWKSPIRAAIAPKPTAPNVTPCLRLRNNSSTAVAISPTTMTCLTSHAATNQGSALHGVRPFSRARTAASSPIASKKIPGASTRCTVPQNATW
jgi:hypothetical protein